MYYKANLEPSQGQMAHRLIYETPDMGKFPCFRQIKFDIKLKKPGVFRCLRISRIINL